MVRNDILGALKSGLARGQSLEKAMMSLYNASYEKKDIEEAAKVLHMEQSKNPEAIKTVSKLKQGVQNKSDSLFKKIFPKKEEKKLETGTKEKQEVKLEPGKSEKPIIKKPDLKKEGKEKSAQKVSKYDHKPHKPIGIISIIFLMFFLLILVGVLISVFLFKDELLRFLNNLI